MTFTDTNNHTFILPDVVYNDGSVNLRRPFVVEVSID